MAATVDMTLVGAALRERREDLGLSQADIALRLERSQAWMSKLERGQIDPRELSALLLRTLLSTLRWTPEEFVQATGLEFPGIEAESDTPAVRSLQMEVHKSKQTISLGLPELASYRQRDLLPFRDGGVLAVLSKVDEPIPGEWAGVEQAKGKLTLHRLCGYTRQGRPLLEDRAGNIEPLPEGAKLLGRVMVRIIV